MFSDTTPHASTQTLYCGARAIKNRNAGYDGLAHIAAVETLMNALKGKTNPLCRLRD